MVDGGASQMRRLQVDYVPRSKVQGHIRGIQLLSAAPGYWSASSIPRCGSAPALFTDNLHFHSPSTQSYSRMMDPISIIGTAGALANIVDVIGQTIKAVRTLRNEWKDADLTLLSLTSKLTALRAALSKIKE